MTVPSGMHASKVMGADFLCFLLTPECVDLNSPPPEEQWQTLDFSKFGKTETQIKHFLEQKAQERSQARSLTGYFYADLLNQAMSQGLIYRLNNPQEEGKAYFGIPLHVRQTLSLEWKPEHEAQETLSGLEPIKENRNLWAEKLRSFLMEVESRAYPEVSEYAAQIALNALRQEHLVPADIPVSLNLFARNLGLVPVPHYAGLTVLLEACRETPLFKQARQLCDCAVDAGLLPAEDVDAVLVAVDAPPVNPFMALF